MTFNKIIIGALLCAPFLSFAETEMVDTTMFCDTTENIVKELSQRYGESPVITGKTSDQANSIMTIWINPITNSWSIVATSKKISCIIGVGEELKVIQLNKLRTLGSLHKDDRGSKINVI